MRGGRGRLLSIFLLAVTLIPARALGSDEPWWGSEFLTGDWNGARNRLAERGIEFELAYTGESISNLAGGITRGSDYLDNVDLIVLIDAEKTLGWRGTTFFLYGLGNDGGDPSERIGDSQIASNIEAPDTWKVYELWTEIDILERLSVLAGLYDLNSEFDVIESAKLFINSSHGIGPDFSQSGRNGPSIFPTTSLGMRTKFQPTPRFYFQAAALDGIPGDPADPEGTQIILKEEDGLLLTAEVVRLFGTSVGVPTGTYRHRLRRIGRLGIREYDGKFALGAWGYTKEQQEISQPAGPLRRSRSWGAYLLTERKIFRERRDPNQGLEWFGRFGVAESRVNRFAAYTGAGLVYTGAFPGRPADQIGVAMAAAYNGSEFREAQRLAGNPVDGAEVSFELTYLANILPWLAVQPDIQYVVNPGSDPTLDNALAVGLRVSISF